MIHVIATGQATPEQIQEMLEAMKTYIKVAVDVRRKTLAGGGVTHVDCESALLEQGSQDGDVWGADWDPEKQAIQFEALLNLRPKQGNHSVSIVDPRVRGTVETIVRERLERRKI